MNKVANAVSEFLRDDIPEFKSGDTINVGVRVVEGGEGKGDRNREENDR